MSNLFTKLKEKKAEENASVKNNNEQSQDAATTNETGSTSSDNIMPTDNDGTSISSNSSSTIGKTTSGGLFTKKKLADANTLNDTTKFPEGNNLHKGINYPPAPPLDASKEERFDYMMQKLNIACEHPIAGREVLAELHDFLEEQHEQKLLPEHMGTVTKVLMSLGAHQHKNAQVRKAKGQARVAKKEAKAEAIEANVEAMGDIF